MPYSVELNDIPMMMIQHHRRGVRLAARCTARRLRAVPGRAAGAKSWASPIHPYITGVPHRMEPFEAFLDAFLARGDIAFLQGRDILRWYEAADDDT